MHSVYAQNVLLIIKKQDAAIKLKSKQSFKNSNEAAKYLKAARESLIRKGYLEASFDSMTIRQDSMFTTLYLGKNMM